MGRHSLSHPNLTEWTESHSNKRNWLSHHYQIKNINSITRRRVTNTKPYRSDIPPRLMMLWKYYLKLGHLQHHSSWLETEVISLESPKSIYYFVSLPFVSSKLWIQQKLSLWSEGNIHFLHVAGWMDRVTPLINQLAINPCQNQPV